MFESVEAFHKWERQELGRMTDKEVVAYHNICMMSLSCIMSEEDRAKTERHLGFMKEIVQERDLA